MYSKSVISRNLDALEAKNGWRPVYHTLQQVEEFKTYVENICKADVTARNIHVTINKNLTRSRQKEIQRFVQNEQLLCAADSNYFEDRYCWICDEKGEIFKFKNRKSQEVFDSILAEFDDREVAIELLFLKARQVGITTKTALKFLHRMMFIPNTQAVMASVQAEKSELIGRILKICHERLPWWLIPKSTTDRIKLWGWANGSILSVQSGTQATGIAQGWTPTCVHLSEIGDTPNPKKTIEEGLMRATHPTRKLFQVFEGTGNGNTGWLADKWRQSKKDWPLGRSRLCPRFISWPMATDLYPEKDWIAKFPVPERWEPCRETRKHVQRCELFINNTEYLSKVVGANWKMPVEQQWFWEFNYLEAVQSHTQKVWMSQMPADDNEALTGKNDTIFEPEVIQVISKERKKEFKAYAITGTSIDDGSEPREADIDYDNEPRIPVVWNSHKGQRYEWVMVPLKPFDEEDERNALDKILIFREPQPGRNYSIGIDTADGLDKEDEERSALVITDSREGEQFDEQCAELCSRRINPAQMVGFAACLSAWYGQKTKDPRGCKFCIEQRDRPGDDCQLQLKLMGFNFHHLMVFYDKKNPKETTGTKQGWYSNRWSVPFMMNRFVEAVLNKWYKPNSRYLVSELKDLERKVTTGINKMEHRSGCYDDRVRAAAHSYITRHHFDILAERAQKRYAGPTQKLPEVNYDFPQGAQISSWGDGW